MTTCKKQRSLRTARMRDQNTFPRFIDSVYAAALDPTIWPTVLAASADYVGGHAAGLITKNTLRGTCVVDHQHGFAQAYLDQYQAEYWKLDPFPASSVFPMSDPSTIKDYVAHADFL